MTLHYRADDPVSGRWTGNTSGVKLSVAQGDENIYTLQAAIDAVVATVTPSRSISSISFNDMTNELTFHMSDSTDEGPFPIVPASFHGRGAWVPDTDYSNNETFYVNGTVYLVDYPHTSGPTFDAGANDGMGHNYYSVMVPNPGNAFPTGGAAGQVSQKSSSDDFAVTWGWKTPAGGTARQYHIQSSDTQDDSEWDTPQARDISFTPSTGSGLISDNVADALEELEGLTGTSETALSGLTDVSFPTGEPQAGGLLYYGGAVWSSSAPLAANDLVLWNGSAFVGAPESSLSIGYSQLSGGPAAAQLRNTTMTALDTTGAVTLDPSLGDVFSVVPTGDITITASSVPAGAEITLVIVTSGATSRTITFSSGTFKSQGTLVTGTASGKYFVVKFVGTNSPANWLVEVSRTVAM